MSRKVTFISLITIYFVFDFVAILLAKKWVDKGDRAGLLGALALYNVCSVCWCIGLRYETVARAAMAYTLFAAVCGVLAGFVWFRERLTAANAAGVVLAFVALALLQSGHEEAS